MIASLMYGLGEKVHLLYRMVQGSLGGRGSLAETVMLMLGRARTARGS